MAANIEESLRAIVVTAHPTLESVVGGTAQAVVDGFRSGGFAQVDHFDVLADGFNPPWNASDLTAYRNGDQVPDDVRDQQTRLERYDAVALVFPVYWWGMPGALKGWVERVFTRGWAYDDTSAGSVLASPKRMYFFAIGAVKESTFVKRGYLEAMRVQMIGGLADYMGAVDSEFVLLLNGESTDPALHREREENARLAAETIAARAVSDRDQSAGNARRIENYSH
ncbi:NAD(P)H-dependent oxidoreductase [Mycolicibacterium conceptionense]|uniref:NAD(P)H-dependent oxidoreductase n=1 Tax=Mycolicibacterium conceptionense TaxID=451644 RepID=UPI00069D77F3|nr:NAD(P)H-dependent oxidoreductase [Mycolicibacterium conceptionense]